MISIGNSLQRHIDFIKQRTEFITHELAAHRSSIGAIDGTSSSIGAIGGPGDGIDINQIGSALLPEIDSLISGGGTNFYDGNGTFNEVAFKEAHPDLYENITQDLGYGVFYSFGDAILADAKNSGVDLSDTAAIEELFLARASLPNSENAVSTTLNSDGKFDSVDPSAQYVRLELEPGNIVTFDGPNSGEIANRFIQIFNNSDLFRGSIYNVVDRHDGVYGVHSLSVEKGTLGYNESRNSGIFLDFNQLSGANPNDYSLSKTLIHEVAHDFHAGVESDSPFYAGEVHSRDQTEFIGAVINDLENAGINTGVDVDGGDYSYNILVLDTDYGTGGQSTIQPINPADFEKNKAIYAEIKDSLENGNIEKAVELYKTIPPDATFELSYGNPQFPEEGTSYTVTYNVRDIVLQDLLLAADSESYFNTSEGTDDSLKSNVSYFTSVLIDDGITSVEHINALADDIGIQFGEDLYLSTATVGDFLPVFTQKLEVFVQANAFASIDGIGKSFFRLDSDAYLSDSDVDKIFEIYDSDKNGLIAGDEISRMISHLTSLDQNTLISDIQPDSEPLVTFSEFEKSTIIALANGWQPVVSPYGGYAPPPLTFEDFFAKLADAGVALTPEAMNFLTSTFDVNGDGAFASEELLTMAERFP